MFFKKRREAKQREAAQEAAWQRTEAERVNHWSDLFNRAEQGDADAQQKIVKRYEFYRSTRAFPELLRRRYAAIKELHQVGWQNAYTSKLLEAWQAAPSPMEKIEALAQLLLLRNSLDSQTRRRLEKEFSFSWDEIQNGLAGAAQAHYEELAAEREDPQKFAELWRLIRRTRRSKIRFGYIDNDLRRVGVKDLLYPDDWNDLVARHYETPALEAFRGQPERGPGQVRLLAAQALKDDDFTQAQIALSYCNGDSKNRVAVGDVLTAELAKLVTRHRAETLQGADSTIA